VPQTTVQISTGTATVHFDQAGSGPGLVLVHGTTANREQWQHLTEHTKSHRTVVSPDYSGSGLTRDAGGPLTLADLATEVVAAVDAAGLDSFDLVGHSLGAVVGALVAADHPNRVRRLVLHAGWVHPDTRFQHETAHWVRLLRADPALFVDYLPLMAFGPRFWHSATPELITGITSEVLQALDVEGAIRQIELDAQADITDRLSDITARTLVVTSRHDRLIDCTQQRTLVSGIHGASQIVSMPGTPPRSRTPKSSPLPSWPSWTHRHDCKRHRNDHGTAAHRRPAPRAPRPPWCCVCPC